MKNRNAFIEALKTKQGKLFAVLSTIVMIAGVCVGVFIPNDCKYKNPIVFVTSIVLIVFCTMFTQVVGAVQNEIDAQQRSEKQQSYHPKKKK